MEPTTRTWPGPSPAPLLGWRREQRRWFRDPVGYLMRLYETYGAVSAWQTKRPRIFAFGPDENRQLTRHPAKFRMTAAAPGPPQPERPQARNTEALNCLRSGLLSLDGDVHRRHRHVVGAAFRQNEVERHHGTIVTVTGRMLDGWRIGDRIDAERAMRRLVHRLALRAVLEADEDETGERLAALVERFVETAPRAMMFPVALPSTSFSRLLRIAGEIVAALEEAIAQKRTRPSAASVLAVLVRLNGEAGGSLSDRELVAEAYNVLCHESTASALTWTLFLLAQHPSDAHALVEELRGVLRGDAPSVTDLDRLPVLDHVVKESMRLLPPAPFMRRFLAEPCELGGRVAPANASVFFSQYVTHRMPDVFRQPRRFLPGRWDTCQPTAHEYFPFGLGPHNCVAGSFAMLEMKVVLAMLLQRYHLRTPPGARVDHVYQLSLRPRAGLHVVVARQDGDARTAEVHGTVTRMVDLP